MIMKTVCIYHSIDLDGWMSAAIVKHWFINEYANTTGIIVGDGAIKADLSVYVNNPSILDFIGYNYGQLIPDLSEYDKVIMCDISFPKKDMENLFDSLHVEFIWIDHHKSALEDMFLKGRSIHPIGRQNVSYAACELTWQYFFPAELMPEIVRLLGRYDCFGHKGTEEETKVLEFQYGARQCISNYEEAYAYLIKDIKYSDPKCKGLSITVNIIREGKSIYQYLCTEAKQSYKNGFEIILNEGIPTIEIIEENGKLRMNPYTIKEAQNKVERKFICINKERFNPINFGIEYHKDGYDGAACFHYANGKWNFSLYNDNGLVDCSVIAKQFGGGGHKGAAGFALSNKDFNIILQ